MSCARSSHASSPWQSVGAVRLQSTAEHPIRLRRSALECSRYSRSSTSCRPTPRPRRCDARLSPRTAAVSNCGGRRVSCRSTSARSTRAARPCAISNRAISSSARKARHRPSTACGWSAAEPRLVAIFLDEYHVDAGATPTRPRGADARFVDQDLAPRDLVVVMKPLDSLLTIRLTRIATDAPRDRDASTGARATTSRGTPTSATYIAGTPARIEAARTQVALSAINALAVHLGSLNDRRKTLVVVSEEIGRAGTAARAGPADARHDHPLGEPSPTSRSIRSIREKRRAPPRPIARSDCVQVLAGETDGSAIAADLDGRLDARRRRRLERLLPDHVSVGAARRRKVSRAWRCGSKRPGVTLRARKGYLGASPDEALRASLLAQANEPKAARAARAAPHVSPLIRPWFGISRGDERQDARDVRLGAGGARAGRSRPRHVGKTARAHGAGRRRHGAVRGRRWRRPDRRRSTNRERRRRAPCSTCRPGRLRLRMSIQDVAAHGDRSGRARDLGSRSCAARWRSARRRSSARGTPVNSATLDVAAAVPVASREFSRTERLLIRFRAYGPPEAPIPPCRRSCSAGRGNAMRELDGIAGPSLPGDDNAIDLPLAGFAAGDYTIEVTAGQRRRRHGPPRFPRDD